MKKAFAIAAVMLLVSTKGEARPLLTEEVPTVGRRSFDATIGISKRLDDFGSPKTTYSTVNFPVRAQLGLSNHFDFGFMLAYLSHRLETQTAHYKGSMNGQFSPFIKYSPWTYLGFELLWHTRTPESGVQDLPAVRGQDFEPLIMAQLPTAWPITFNVGYIFRGNYKSKLGISNDIAYHIDPGNIFEAKTAIEIPIRWHFAILGELAYYNTGGSTVENRSIGGSAGEAMDGLVGLTWGYAGWNIGAGAAFGLLEERHTSFDLERGAGDVLYKVNLAYKLTPKRLRQ